MHKSLIMAVLIAASPFALANPIIDKVIELDIHRLAQDTSNEKSIGRVRHHVLKRDLSDVMQAWSISSRQSDNPQKWAEIGVNILHWAYPDTEHRWLNGITFPLVQGIIYQQDSLIDLDRIEYQQRMFDTRVDRGTSYQVVDTNSKGSTPRLSSDLMLNGSAPIGPDNKPVKVCTLGLSSAAPYLELSATQLEAYQRDTGLDFSRCLYGSTESAYWVTRFSDMKDPYHDLTPRHDPKGGWRK